MNREILEAIMGVTFICALILAFAFILITGVNRGILEASTDAIFLGSCFYNLYKIFNLNK